MKNGPQIPPVVAGIVIAIVVVVVGIILYRGTGTRKGGVAATDREKMIQYMERAGMGTPGKPPAPGTGRGGLSGGGLSATPPPNAPR